MFSAGDADTRYIWYRREISKEGQSKTIEPLPSDRQEALARQLQDEVCACGHTAVNRNGARKGRFLQSCSD